MMVRRGKTEKVSVTLPRELAGEIRSMVTQGEVSSFFTEALEYYLAYRKQKLALEQGFGAWKDENHLNLNTPQDSTDFVRNLREEDKKRLERLGGSLAE
jgi:Arc/MetJ-type ribon-helix-helix transcriptional regulator